MKRWSAVRCTSRCGRFPCPSACRFSGFPRSRSGAGASSSQASAMGASWGISSRTWAGTNRWASTGMLASRATSTAGGPGVWRGPRSTGTDIGSMATFNCPGRASFRAALRVTPGRPDGRSSLSAGATARTRRRGPMAGSTPTSTSDRVGISGRSSTVRRRISCPIRFPRASTTMPRFRGSPSASRRRPATIRTAARTGWTSSCPRSAST